MYNSNIDFFEIENGIENVEVSRDCDRARNIIHVERGFTTGIVSHIIILTALQVESSNIYVERRPGAARQVVTKHIWDIDVRSSIGTGTCIFVTDRKC